MNITSYKNYLSSRGQNLSQVKRIQSDQIMNNTFTADPTYKRVYVLTRDGWKWEDAKYQFHTAPSVSKDAVDYYLQFRPKVHYPVGSYVIVPDDTDFDINLSESEKKNPFSQPTDNRTQWWMIVGRDEANAFVRYMILKCDWDFKWIYKGKLMSCWACSKSANSYTSGVWRDEYSTSSDNLTSSWLPDTHFVYGDKLEELGISFVVLGSCNMDASADYTYKLNQVNIPQYSECYLLIEGLYDSSDMDEENGMKKIPLNLVHKNGTIYFELVKKYYYDSSDGMLYQNDKSGRNEISKLIIPSTFSANDQAIYYELHFKDFTAERTHMVFKSYATFKIKWFGTCGDSYFCIKCIEELLEDAYYSGGVTV